MQYILTVCFKHMSLEKFIVVRFYSKTRDAVFISKIFTDFDINLYPGCW